MLFELQYQSDELYRIFEIIKSQTQIKRRLYAISKISSKMGNIRFFKKI